jgi:protein-tyrosine phosphatase
MQGPSGDRAASDEGLVDIHCHFLPGVDDGPVDFGVTLEMLAIAREDGIASMVATPHADTRYTFDAERCRDELDRIRAEHLHGPTTYAGCELRLTPENLDAVLRDPVPFAINGKDCVLLELPNPAVAQPVRSSVQLLVGRGIRPIVAHPERNYLFQRDASFAAEIVGLGAYIQVTGGSLLGSFGIDAQRTCRALLKRRLVHAVASDCHGAEHRRPILSAAYAEVARLHGRSAAELLFVTNPRACIFGREIVTIRSVNLFSSLFRKSDEYSNRVLDVS